MQHLNMLSMPFAWFETTVEQILHSCICTSMLGFTCFTLKAGSGLSCGVLGWMFNRFPLSWGHLLCPLSATKVQTFQVQTWRRLNVQPFELSHLWQFFIPGERNAILQLVFLHSSTRSRSVQRTMLIKKPALDPSEIEYSRSKSALDWTHQKLNVTNCDIAGPSELFKVSALELLQLLDKFGPQVQQCWQTCHFRAALFLVPWTLLQVWQDIGGCHGMLVEFCIVTFTQRVKKGFHQPVPGVFAEGTAGDLVELRGYQRHGPCCALHAPPVRPGWGSFWVKQKVLLVALTLEIPEGIIVVGQSMV